MNNNIYFSSTHNTVCKIVNEETLWGETFCSVWLQNEDRVVKVKKDDLRPVGTPQISGDDSQRITYLAAAGKIAEVLEKTYSTGDDGLFLAPMESEILPLPHQLQALGRSLEKSPIRFLFADEVGLGKTIEAGLVLKELKLRGLVKRILIVAPKGITVQWVSEMRTHFKEKFRIILPEDLRSVGKLELTSSNRMMGYAGNNMNESEEDEKRSNAWEHFDQIIVPLDSVKPMEGRQGWSREKVEEYNRTRYEDLITAGWDLVIIDEAHRLGGSSETVARHKLGEGLAEASPHLLMLTATPHQGKSDSFYRLIKLLDEKEFPDLESISREKVEPYVVRTEKRKAIDADGNPLFKPRTTELVTVRWEEKHKLQRILYEELTAYIEEGYNKALIQKRQYIGFLMLLMQRLVTSSTRAIERSLRRRIDVLSQGSFMQGIDNNSSEESFSEEDYYELDGQELLDTLIERQEQLLADELKLVNSILEIAEKCGRMGPDVKAEVLLSLLEKLQQEEDEPELKMLIFTEFVPTQEMLREYLEARGITVAVLNGSMSIDERKIAEFDFRDKARVLVSTDAGGEGLNLQFCHIVVNYDLPWNPMRIEQRIGRVDRIGQKKNVRAFNFIFKDTVESRVREVLEIKLAVILREFGIDKTGDVLDTAQAGKLFEDVFAKSITNPDNIEDTVDSALQSMAQQIRESKEGAIIEGISSEPDKKIADKFRKHPLSDWLEIMTTNYITANGGTALKKRFWWHLRWPGGLEQDRVVFRSSEMDRTPDLELLNLESEKVRALIEKVPYMVEGSIAQKIWLSDLPYDLEGHWALFEMRIEHQGSENQAIVRIPKVRRRFFPVFVSKENDIFHTTAKTIWDNLLTDRLLSSETISREESLQCFTILKNAAEKIGKDYYLLLKKEHEEAVNAERLRGNYFYNSRERAIKRVGLREVRNYRLRKLEEEKSDWQHELTLSENVVPGLSPVIITAVGKS